MILNRPPSGAGHDYPLRYERRVRNGCHGNRKQQQVPGRRYIPFLLGADCREKIDQMVVALVQKEYSKAEKILSENIGKLHELAKYLYDETITGEEFMDILNRERRHFRR